MKKQLLSLTLLLSFTAINFAPLSAADPHREFVRQTYLLANEYQEEITNREAQIDALREQPETPEREARIEDLEGEIRIFRAMLAQLEAELEERKKR